MIESITKNPFVVQVLIIFVVLNLITCSNSDQIVDLKKDGTFTLKFGQTKTFHFADKKYSIEFLDIDDKRCFKRECAVCYGSTAVATIRISSADSTETVNLTHLGCVFGYTEKDVPHDLQRINRKDAFTARVFNLNIGMLELGPYPESSYPKKKNYFVKIFIYK